MPRGQKLGIKMFNPKFSLRSIFPYCHGYRISSKLVRGMILVCWIRIWGQKPKDPAPRCQNLGKNSRVRLFNPKFLIFGHNSSPRKFWEVSLGGDFSYRPRGAFYTKILEIKPQGNQNFGGVKVWNPKFTILEYFLLCFPSFFQCSCKFVLDLSGPEGLYTIFPVPVEL